jgi:DnaK suppressor protein
MKTNLLNKRDITLFHDVLKKESSELRDALRNRAGAAIESVAEECERTVLAGQRELTVELVDRASKQLRDVESALRRLAEGCYGTCTDCDEPISDRRLTAIPWASRCVGCQELADEMTRTVTKNKEGGLSTTGRAWGLTVSGPSGRGGLEPEVALARVGEAQ